MRTEDARHEERRPIRRQSFEEEREVGGGGPLREMTEVQRTLGVGGREDHEGCALGSAVDVGVPELEEEPISSEFGFVREDVWSGVVVVLHQRGEGYPSPWSVLFR